MASAAFDVPMYRARCARVVDGDTVDLVVDLGFYLTGAMRFRLYGINCPEVHGATKAAGDKATARTTQLIAGLDGDWPLRIHTYKSDDFGRWLATIWVGDADVSINDVLVNEGFAVPYRRK